MKTKIAPNDRFAPGLRRILLGVLTVIFHHGHCNCQAASARENSTAEELRSPEFVEGKALAAIYCNQCHLQPPPDALDKVTWGMEVLPDMGDWLGFRKFALDEQHFDRRVLEANILHKSPQVSRPQWQAICRYYLESAPSKFATPKNRQPIAIGLKGFDVIFPEKTLPASTTMVKIDPASKFIYIGNSATNTLTVLDAQGGELMSSKMASPPVDIEIGQDNVWVTLVGSYLPSDNLMGQLVTIGHPGDSTKLPRIVLKDLPRPVNTKFADLNGDGLKDILLCGYGNILGEFCWFEQLHDGTYQKHTLESRPGAISAEIYDFNQDGRPDIAVMFAQAREGIYLFINKGGGQFEQQVVAEKHAGWGFSHLELVDANGDGEMDLLACNGDNGDSIWHLPPFKPYHGIRLYLNKGKNQFSESWFYPMNGAYKTITRDFDHDGDLDIAAISFYPDYQNFPNQGFIYLENKGGWKFESSSFAQSIQGRWLTMDAGDLDGDGDQDIVLGAFVDGPTAVPALLKQQWLKATPPVIILKNKTRQ